MKLEPWKVWIPGVVMALGVVLAGAGAVNRYLSDDARALLAAGPADLPSTELPAVTVYKNAGCGCCSAWAQHLREAGFEVTEEAVEDLEAVKDRYHVPRDLRSCHTAVVGDYIVEGHVPAEDVLRLLRERPGVVGLAVPGMPVGSPGMEVPGARPDPFASLTFDEEGSTGLWAHH